MFNNIFLDNHDSKFYSVDIFFYVIVWKCGNRKATLSKKKTRWLFVLFYAKLEMEVSSKDNV